jgi:hypothetical protein
VQQSRIKIVVELEIGKIPICYEIGAAYQQCRRLSQALQPDRTFEKISFALLIYMPQPDRQAF